jgi:hypothetical protein
VTYWYGTDPDPDPALFVSDLQDAKKKEFFLGFCLLLFEGTFTSVFTEKSHKEVTKQWKSRFFFYFCLMMELS